MIFLIPRNIRSIGILILTAHLLISCSSARNYGKVDYSKLDSAEKLLLPPDLATSQKAIDARAKNTQKPITNSDDVRKAVAAKEAEHVYIERSGNQRWLVVEESAEDVWPRLKGFFLELNTPIAIEIPDIGLLETDWSERRVKTPEINSPTAPQSVGTRDKFRVRLERAAPGVSEIYLTQRGLIERFDASGKASWQSNDDVQTEAEYLSRLLQWFKKNKNSGTNTTKTITASSSARFIKGGSTEVTNDNAQNLAVDTLVLSDSLDIAFRRLGLALDRASFTMIESNRDKGVYKIQYFDPAIEEALKKKGNQDKNGKELRADQIFFLQMTLVTNETHVTLLNESGKSEDSPYQEKILKILLEQLR